MIIKIDSENQLNICLEIIHKSFQTVADDFNLTRENCPGQTAFISLEKLVSQFESNMPMFLYTYESNCAGYFSLLKKGNYAELNNLAVLPEYRHLGIGRDMIEYAKSYSKSALEAEKITIGIIEENTVLKEWYKALGFIHTGTKKFAHLPFTVGFMELKLY